MCCLTKFYQTGSISLKSMAVFLLTVLRSVQENFKLYHDFRLFQVSDEAERLLGYALYLGPSILDHSCKPTAEVRFLGSRIEVRCKTARSTTDLRQISISYIDKNLGRDERRRILQKHFHFDCLCVRCLNEKADPPPWLTEMATFNHRVAAELQVSTFASHYSVNLP